MLKRTGFGYAYADSLPPESWPSNFDGENFVSTNGDSAYGAFVVEEPMMDGSYWLAAHEEDPQPVYPAEEDASTTFADLRWNNFAWYVAGTKILRRLICICSQVLEMCSIMSRDDAQFCTVRHRLF